MDGLVLVCGLTPDEMTSSVVGTMEDVATGCLPGLKVFEPTRPENEAAAVDDVTIQVDLDLPVHQHGMAQFQEGADCCLYSAGVQVC